MEKKRKTRVWRSDLVVPLVEGIHYSRSMEDAVLGSMTLFPEALSSVYGLLQPHHFHILDNQKIYRFLVDRHERGAVTGDALLVWQDMCGRRLHEDLNLTKGVPNPTAALFAHLVAQQNYVVNPFLTTHYAVAIMDMWKTREMEMITSRGINPEQSLLEQAYDIRSKLDELMMVGGEADWESAADLAVRLFKHQEKIARGEYKFVTTGFPSLDKENGGFAGGNMIVVAARPGVGKSAVMAKMAIAAAKQGKKVGIISLEMSNTEVAGRLASLDTKTSFSTIYRNLFIEEAEHRRFYEKVQKSFSTLPIWVSDKTDANVGKIRAKAFKLRTLAGGLDELWIDYLQLVPPSSDQNKNRTREQEVAMLSRGIKLLAKELDIPIIVLAQLNRASESRSGDNRYPRLSDLRESGAIEQDADVVIVIHRDWVVGIESVPEGEDDEGETTEDRADLIVRKWRNASPNLHLTLRFNGPLMEFEEWINEKDNQPKFKVYVSKDFTQAAGVDEEDPF